MTDIDAMLVNLAIAAVLYLATYFSFVHLLKYPRNWNLPSKSTALTTSILVILTISFVSWTPEGFDISVLTALTGFLIVLFYVMAAPAIAFQPASKHIEFLAKHGDYSGLCVSMLALVAGLAVSNSKPQAVLVVAFLIELSWFIRLRWANRKRKVYTLNEKDLSVLNIQSKGDLETFRRRHNIHELVHSQGSVVGWKGCNKNTAPCPFNLYVNRLGLNTAPCCREHMRDLCHHISAGLDEIGVVYWLEGGSLLGAVREDGALLDWEDDVDISVLLDDTMTWDQLASGLAAHGARQGYYVDLFKKKGFISISFDRPKLWPFRWERNRMRGEIRADIAIYRKAVSDGKKVVERRTAKGNLSRTQSGWYGLAQETVLPTSTLAFVGGEFACPNQPKTYLSEMYGDFQKVEYTYLDPEAAKMRADNDAFSDLSD